LVEKFSEFNKKIFLGSVAVLLNQKMMETMLEFKSQSEVAEGPMIYLENRKILPTKD
jgi:hypothetical protein